MKTLKLVPITGIVGIVILEGIALFKGINGALFMTSLAIIGGIAGYEIRNIKEFLKTLR